MSYRFNLMKASVSNVKDVQRQLSNQHSSTFFATFLCQDTGEHDKKPDTDNYKKGPRNGKMEKIGGVGVGT